MISPSAFFKNKNYLLKLINKKALVILISAILLSIVSIFVTVRFSQKDSPDIAKQNKEVLHVRTSKTIIATSTPPQKKLTKAVISPTMSEKKKQASMSPTLKPPTATRSIYLGMWTQGLWDESTWTLHPEKLVQLQNTIGKKVAIAHYYRGWENLGRESIVNELQSLSSNGWRPMISANPAFISQCESHGKSLYKAIADGHCDEFLHKAGRNFKQYGSPLFLRFAWEMNIEPIEWSIQKTGSSPADYIQAWRRFHDIVVAEGATNVAWVFSPNVQTNQSIPFRELYPGDSYVDWIGLDGYNWGKTQSWSSWQSFTTIFETSYWALTALAPAKPLMIAEVNTTDVGGDKAGWYQNTLSVELPNKFPRIKAIVFYNENRPNEGVNWLIDVSPTSLQSFSENIKHPMYVSSF